jgi:DNA-binding PucR family transcriptional regulator
VTADGRAQRSLAFVPDSDPGASGGRGAGPGGRPPSRRARLAEAVAGLPAALGPTVALAGCPRSAARARRALDLRALGLLPGEDLVVAEEHAAALVLHADTGLASALAEECLAPLAELRSSSRARLTETLRAWLDCQGRVDETARVLEIHPQTVRYRLNQLREAFGSALDDPEARFELALALRVRRASG